MFNEEKENDDYNISFQNLFSVIESLTKVKLPLQIRAQNNNKQFLIEKSQYNDLLQCIMRHTISEFFIKISELYNNEKEYNNIEKFTEKFENMYKTMQNSCYKFILQFDNFKMKRKLNEYAYSDNTLDNAKKFAIECIKKIDSKQNEFKYVKELIAQYSNIYMSEYLQEYFKKYANYRTQGLYYLINMNDFQNEIKNELNKIKLNVYNVSSLLNYVYKQKNIQLPSYIYYNISKFVGTKNDPKYTYILTCDCRNNKKYNIVIVDIEKNKANNIKTNYSNNNISTGKTTEEIYNYEQPIVKIFYKKNQDHHKGIVVFK